MDPLCGFRSYHGLMDSVWPAVHVYGMGLHSSAGRASADAEATGSNPVKPRKSFLGIFFFGLLRNCLNYDYNCDSHFIEFFVAFIL